MELSDIFRSDPDLFSAGYDYIESTRDTADDKDNLMWYGWALREAFWAGARWEQRRRKKEG